MSAIRNCCIAAAVVFLLPQPPAATIDATPAMQPSWHVMEKVSARFEDVRLLCGKNPEICRTADLFAERLETKTKYGLHLIYQWAEEATNPRSILAYDQALSDPMPTGSVGKAGSILRGTLLPHDLPGEG